MVEKFVYSDPLKFQTNLVSHIDLLPRPISAAMYCRSVGYCEATFFFSSFINVILCLLLLSGSPLPLL